MLRYRTEMLDAGIPMPAASASLPMHSNANRKKKESERVKGFVHEEGREGAGPGETRRQ